MFSNNNTMTTHSKRFITFGLTTQQTYDPNEWDYDHWKISLAKEFTTATVDTWGYQFNKVILVHMVRLQCGVDCSPEMFRAYQDKVHEYVNGTKPLPDDAPPHKAYEHFRIYRHTNDLFDSHRD